ncbi:Toprim domain and Zn-finger domain [Halapricum desulfuricans]|uniref:Toprim domain and Zn-finger domain n=1 Tax=Halapricum desulfuricans TaxID=2841257 RepID=A0A897NHW4_9EURY|nr:helix-hairpin-helix domain-containing protein [Halapricum desulfuricans]QSG10563.1 Toprim domain and Zn-finger domain [Halapricum desulfuricans]
MTMEEYPSDTDFRVFVEEKFGRDRTQDFLRSNKNFLVHANSTEDIANVTRRILFGYDESEHLKKGLLEQEQEEKATAFTFKTDDELDDLERELSRASSTERVFDENKNIKISDVTQTDHGFEVDIEYVYWRHAQRNLMDSQDKKASISVEQTGEDDVVKVNQDYRKYDELGAVQDFFDGWNQYRMENGNEPLDKGDIVLERLRIEDRVDFFDDILSENPGNWRFDQAIKLGLRQGDAPEEMFDDADGDIEDRLDEELRGITNAVLTGEGLRGNDFVQQCISNGYYFKSGKLRFVNTDVAEQVEIAIEFKQEPRSSFDISIEQEYETVEEGEREPTTFEETRRDEIRDTFRDLVIELYGQKVDLPDLIEERNTPQELTELPGVGETVAENLRDAGYDSVQDVYEADMDDLMEIQRIGESKAEELTQ